MKVDEKIKKLNLKKLRESYGETPEDFAGRMGVPVETVRKWEKDSSGLSIVYLLKLVKSFGMSLEELLSTLPEPPEPICPENSWKASDAKAKTLMECISNAMRNDAIPRDLVDKYLSHLEKSVDQNLRKPKLTVVGRSDAGKSTLINMMLGADKMPTSWTPTTSIAVYIKDIADRPSFIKEEVWVFANQVGEEEAWNERRLQDSAYCNRWKIAAGNIGLLESLGTHQGNPNNKAPGSAVVFLDAPILKTCDIIDLPGFGTADKNDDAITAKTASQADVLVYLCQASNFLHGPDIEYLKKLIRNLPIWENKKDCSLPPLSNLFIVASQAHVVKHGNIQELTKILSTGYNNLRGSLEDGYWDERSSISGYTMDEYVNRVLPSRFYTYTTDIPNLCKQFNKDLKKVLEQLPDAIEKKTSACLKECVSSCKPTLNEDLWKYTDILTESESKRRELEEIQQNEPARMQQMEENKKHVHDKIQKLRENSISEFKSYCAAFINVDDIKVQIDKENLKNSNDEVERFASRLQGKIQQQAENILRKNTNVLSGITQQYVEDFSKSVHNLSIDSTLTAGFDAAWEFTSALSSIGVVGGLGAAILGWAGVFFLPGALLAGSLGTASAIGAIFGPVGLVAGLAISGVMGLISLFGGGWKNKVAQEIVKTFEKNNIQGKFVNAMNQYWDQTDTAFSHAAKAVDDKWEMHVEEITRIVEEANTEELVAKINALKMISDVFEDIQAYCK